MNGNLESLFAPLWGALLAGGLTSFVVSLLLVLTKHWHGHLSMDTQFGIQKFHTNPTPRVGGVAIVAGAVCVYVVSPHNFYQGMYWPLLLAGIPAFVFGLLEDITKRVSVRTRLLATMFCGVLGWLITGYSITDVNLPGIDWLLGFTVVSVAFTAFAVGGVANAVNIIDGFNGLASGVVIIMFAGLGLISYGVGDAFLVYVCMVLAVSVLGFLLVNWPMGRLFLGDGGSYFLGFALAWVSVLLLARHPEVSAWAPLLVCGYPILEVLFSIVRRHRRGVSPGHPDRLHLHSLAKRRLVWKLLPRAPNLVRNSVTGAIMWLAALPPMLIAIAYPTNNANLVVGFFVCAFMYSAVYARLSQFAWCFKAATLKTMAEPAKSTTA